MPHRKRSTVVIILAGVFSLGILHPVQATSQADVLSQQTISQVNKERAAKKAPRLAESACLKKYAQRQAARMAAQHNMKHQDLYAVGRACGLSAVGENLAVNYTQGRQIVAAWKRSLSPRQHARPAVPDRRNSGGARQGRHVVRGPGLRQEGLTQPRPRMSASRAGSMCALWLNRAP